MPLIVDGNQVPSRWLERKRATRVDPSYGRGARSKFVRIALINNMPDSALEDTELQFFELLDAASEDLPVLLKLYSLTGVPRSDRGMRHLNSFYFDLAELWASDSDGVIITGTEPHHANLKDEPYWSHLSNVLDWAERSTASTILSCLAAHASVLHSDGITRHRLSDKQFGVFRSERVGAHLLVDKLGSSADFPHSRWNEVCESDLEASGYTVLTKSSAAGVDMFVKKKSRSMFVYFQGHPEYGSQTLFKEYRRDVKRFLKGERETYPTMPVGYFNPKAVGLLNEFQDGAVVSRRENFIDGFPESVCENLSSKWHVTASSIYRNWLNHLAHETQDSKNTPFARTRVARHVSVNSEIA